MRFRDPYYLYLLILWIPLILLYVKREKRQKTALRYSTLSTAKTIRPTLRIKLRHITALLRIVGSGFLIIALARPQKGITDMEVTAEGIDIMLVLDISNSMRALDFQPDDRLVVSKQRIHEFINMRNNDRIGLVIFAARAFTKCPLTLDHSFLMQLLEQVSYTDFSNGTAIGTAIATAANRLQSSESESRVIILLTDGANNMGDIPPMAAARAAAELGIRVYTIGVGREGQVPFPVQTVHPLTGQTIERIQMIESDLDEPQLIAIAEMTGGAYFRAQDANTLKDIYSKIDELEKSQLVSMAYTTYSEHFFLWLWIGFALLLLEAVLQNTVFRKIP